MRHPVRARLAALLAAVAVVTGACSATISDLTLVDGEVISVEAADPTPTGGATPGADGSDPDDPTRPGGSGEDAGDGGAGGAPTPAGPQMPFTGLASEDDERLGLPAVAVRIDNSRDALPQRGLGEADIVVENLVEGGLTRLLAVFHTTIPGSVGPVRSARSSDIDILANFSQPAFAYWSSNAGVAAELAAAVAEGKLLDLGIDLQSLAYYREDVPGRAFELTGYVRPPEIVAIAPRTGAAPVPVFAYGSDSGGGSPVAGVKVDWGGGQDVSFVWSSAAAVWVRSAWGGPHLGEDGLVLAPANVVILETDYTVSAADARSPQAITTGEGAAIVLVGGRLLEATWERPDVSTPWRLIDGSGAAVELTPGQTWVELIPAGAATELEDEPAAALLGAAEVFLGG